MHRSQITFGVVSLVIMIQVGCQPEPTYQSPPPPKVTVVKPEVKNVPIFLVENGETEAVEQAVVQARVRGILEEIRFEPDSVVTEGQDILFVIQQAEYLAAVKSGEAAVSSAKAAQASAEAALGVADAQIAVADAAIEVSKAVFGRMERLIETNAVSQNEFDEVKAQLQTSIAAKQGTLAAKIENEAGITNAKAKVQQAEADLEQAQLKLDWTTVKAPISGRISKTLVKRGNLVESGTPLIEIVKNNPIWANFNINERFLLNLERHSDRKKGDTIDLTNIKAELQRSGDTEFPFKGHLDYFDPKVDQDTGTLQMRAVFENPPGGDVLLLPGLFVRVRIQIGQIDDAMLIPERAISRDQTGAFVYVVGKDKKAIRKNVKLGSKYEQLMVVETGLEQNDSVIVVGLQRVRDGAEVDPS